MRIAVFLPDFRKGGAQAMMINLANHWAASGHDVHVIAGTIEGGLSTNLHPSIPVTTGKGSGAFSGFMPLRNFLADEKPDALVSALYHANIVAGLVTATLGFRRTKIVLSERNHLSSSLNDLPFYKRVLILPLLHLAYRFADYYIGISKGVSINLEDEFGLCREKITTIYNPVVTPEFAAKAAAPADHPWLKNKDLPVLIAAGRLTTQKDYPTMLRAFASVLKEKPCRLIVLGTGNQESAIKQFAQSLGVADSVDFVGQVESPLPYMAASDIFVFSSAWEGFGNVLVEALYCGLPIVSTDCPFGPSEILENGKYGVLCPVGGHEAFARAILNVLEKNPFPAEAQKKRAEDFSVERVSFQYLDVMGKRGVFQTGKDVRIVASKFPPEYSGPGVRVPKLYKAIGPQLNAQALKVYCNGIEITENKSYAMDGLYVRRRTAYFLKKFGRGLGRFVPGRVLNAVFYQVETLYGLIDLWKMSAKNTSYVHVLGHSGATAAALWIAGFKNIPTIVELVNAGAVAEQKFFFSKVRPRGRFKIVAISKALERLNIERGFAEKDIWARPNPVNAQEFCRRADEKDALRETLGLFGKDDIVLLYIAKFMPRKNQLFLPDILAQLSERYKLVLAGPAVSAGTLQDRDDAYMKEIEAKISTLGLSDRVKIVKGFVNSAEYMNASDIYCMPPWGEGLGTPMLEAMACGLPVIASEEEAFKEWISEGRNGHVLPLQPKLWAEKIEALSSITDAQRNAISKDIISQVSFEKISKDYLNVIAEITR